MVTIKQIDKHLNTFANDHLQIHRYQFVDHFLEINTSGVTNYPLMGIAPISGKVEKGQVSYQFEIMICDLVQKGDGDWLDVLNDMQRVASDIVTELRQGGMSGKYDWQMQENISMTAFKEKWDEEVTGWSFRVTLVSDFFYDQCSIPTT